MKFIVLIFLQGCEDVRPDCSWIAQMSKDERNKYCEDWKDDQAVKQCAKTCQFCKYNRRTDSETQTGKSGRVPKGWPTKTQT